MPNPKYWGTKPKIGEGRLPVRPRERGRARGGQDRPGRRRVPDAADRRRSTSSTRSRTSTYQVDFGNSFEALWLNAKAFPLDSQAVRQAIGYATDRQAIVDQILKPSIRRGTVLQSFIVPTFKQYYVPAFAEYTPEPGEGRLADDR